MDIGTNWPWAGRMVLAICYGIGSSLRSKVVEGYRLALLHVLSQDVGVLGVFSDWPATTTFYANCMGLVSEEEDEEDPGSGPFGGKAGKTAKTAKDGKLFKSHED